MDFMRAGRAFTSTAAVVGALALTACGDDDDASPSPSSTGSGSKSSANQSKLGIQLLDTASGFSQETAAGAQAAAKEVGASLKVSGPNLVNPTESQTQVQGLLNTGLDGMAIGPEPAALWTKTLSDADSKLKGNVVGFNVAPMPGPVDTYVGSDTTEIGQKMVEAAIKEGNVPADTTGEVLIGICVPQSTPLNQTVTGMKETLKTALPNAKVVGPVNVGIEPAKNLAAWQQLVRAHPKTVLALGPCNADGPSMIKARGDVGGRFAVGATGTNPQVYAGLKDGSVSAVVEQSWYLVGYGAIRLVEAKLDGEKPKPGWYDPGVFIITKDNVETYVERDASPESQAAHWKPLTQKFWSEISTKAKPLEEIQPAN